MQESIEDLIRSGRFKDPHSFLGVQTLEDEKRVIRIWRPKASVCSLEIKGESARAYKIHESGLFECEIPKDLAPTDYRIVHSNGQWAYDPYAFEKTLGELDIHLLTKGLHYELYDLLGASVKTHQGVKGINFAVWAPNAAAVLLLGDFNDFDGRMNPMRSVGLTGVWELFIPELPIGEKYKFEVITNEGEHLIKSDPVAHFLEMRPGNGSITFDVDAYQWNDSLWLEERGEFRCGNMPVHIYEVHLGSWKNDQGHFLNYRDLAKELVDYCKKMHFTHVELIGICEHPLDESWGYQVTGYFAPTSRHGSPEDFQFLIDTLHQNKVGVILDWVPAHFPTDSHSLSGFDGTKLYEHGDPFRGFQPEWNTHIFNWGRWEVSNFLIASALFWLKKMHIDGLRVDAVSSMIYLDYGRDPGQWTPNEIGTNVNLEAIEFIKHLNSIIHSNFPDALMIAEESTAFSGVTKEVEEGGLGFDLKWNLGWMNDTLSFFSQEFDSRAKALATLSFIHDYAFNEKFVLVLSHDEVVHEKKSLLSKMPGNDWEKRAGLRQLLAFMMTFPGKKLLFMGAELGQTTEWNCKGEIPWALVEEESHGKLQNMVAALGLFYRDNGALFERDEERESFEWVAFDEQVTLMGFMRKGLSQNFLCLHHFHPEKVEKYIVPLKGVQSLREVFNTDSKQWGGSGMMSPQIEIRKGQILIDLPPIATQIFEVEFHRDDV